MDQGSHLTLLTVVPNPPAAAATVGMSPQRLADQMETEAATRLREVAATLPRDLAVTTVLRRGDVRVVRDGLRGKGGTA